MKISEQVIWSSYWKPLLQLNVLSVTQVRAINEEEMTLQELLAAKISEAEIMGFLQDRIKSGHITSEEYCHIPPATVIYCIRRWLEEALRRSEQKAKAKT